MQPFARLNVQTVIAGGTQVSWEMNRHFIDPGPYYFQLQVEHVALDVASWENVGAVVVDTFSAVDSTKRVFGKVGDTHYRVQLNTPIDVYYSAPAATEGLLSKRDWLKWREIYRKEGLRHRALTSVNGFLLKARRYGPRCPICTDSKTEEITWTNCDTCFGTGFQTGYYVPLAASYADIGLATNRDHRDPQKGMDNPVVITGRFLADPQLYSYDVWCDANSGKRYYIQKVAVSSHVRAVPVTYDVELRLAPFTDVIYTYPLDNTNTLGQGTSSIEQPLMAQKCNNTQPALAKLPRLSPLDSMLAEMKERKTRLSQR